MYTIVFEAMRTDARRVECLFDRRNVNKLNENALIGFCIAFRLFICCKCFQLVVVPPTVCRLKRGRPLNGVYQHPTSVDAFINEINSQTLGNHFIFTENTNIATNSVWKQSHCQDDNFILPICHFLFDDLLATCTIRSCFSFGIVIPFNLTVEEMTKLL